MTQRIKEEWNINKSQYSEQEKIQFLRRIFADQFTFFQNTEIFFSIFIEIAAPSPEFIELLNDVVVQLIRSPVYPNLLTPLITLGSEKPEIARKILEIIHSNGKYSRLIAASGHLLGGIYITQSDEYTRLLESAIHETNEDLLLSYVKGFRIVCKSKVSFSDIDKGIISGLIERNIVNINCELIFLSIENISKDREFFFTIIQNLITQQNLSYRAALFNPLINFNDFREDEIYSLIESSKDCDDGNILNDMANILIKHPQRARENMNIFFYWIRKRMIFKGLMVDYYLTELAKGNPKIIEYYIKEYLEFCHELGGCIDPFPFEFIIFGDVYFAVEIIKDIPVSSDLNDKIQLKLFKTIIGYCYKDKEHFPTVKDITIFLLTKYSETPFLEISISKKLLQSTKLDQSQYNSFIDQVAEFLEFVRDHWEISFNFDFILSEIADYPKLKEYSYEVLSECKAKKTYSPLLLFLQPEQSKPSGELHLSNWGKAWLRELEDGLKIYEDLSNTKYYTLNLKKKHFRDILKKTSNFWSFLYEITVINRINFEGTLQNDVNFGYESDLDLSIKTGNSNLLFEVTSIRMPRDLKISNEAVFMKTLSYQTINQKIYQLNRSGGGAFVAVLDNYYFFIIINIDQCPLGEEDIASSLFGPPSAIMDIDPSTKQVVHTQLSRDISQSVLLKNPNSKYVNGIIFFKTHNEISQKGEPKIDLTGEIIENPLGKNKLPDTILSHLRDYFFNNN
jgi:hypothetical protein